MKRVCVIDIAGLSPRLLAGRERLWINQLPQKPHPMAATFPAVSASVQASMTTGAEPGSHGVIAGGLYRRGCREISLAERSNTLLRKKRFWHAREMPQRPKVALVFWANPLAGAADVVLGANTYYDAEAELVGQPQDLYWGLRTSMEPFDRATLWGPKASWHCARWIGAAARHIWSAYRPDLQWVYLPGLNFELIRHGLDSPEASDALERVDSFARHLAAMVAEDDGETLVVSDGGYVPVEKVGSPNLRLREAGLLKVVAGPRGETPDMDRSRAIAMVDHQIAHIFAEDEVAADEAARAVASDPAVASVVHRDELFAEGPGRDRAGERIVLARGNAWLSYRWWFDDSAAPPLARTTDMAAKCGYDPCELLAGAGLGIDPDVHRVRASRGLTGVGLADRCMLAATVKLPKGAGSRVTDLPHLITRIMFGQ